MGHGKFEKVDYSPQNIQQLEATSVPHKYLNNLCCSSKLNQIKRRLCISCGLDDNAICPDKSDLSKFSERWMPKAS